MALISVMSAKGAPGATTTAMLLANLWPGETMLVDADPLGGDIAMRLLNETGQPLDRDRGLMSLLPAARRGLTPELVLPHAQQAIGGQSLVAGLPGPEQALAVTPLWPTIGRAFAEMPGVDVVADVGQVHARSAHISLIEHSSALILVLRPTAWGALHAQRRLESLGGLLREHRVYVGVVAVADRSQERDTETALATVLADAPWAHNLGTITHDPKSVVMFEGGTVARPERRLLVRSGQVLAARLFAEVHGSGSMAVAGQSAAPTRRGKSKPPKAGRGKKGKAARGAEEERPLVPPPPTAVPLPGQPSGLPPAQPVPVEPLPVEPMPGQPVSGQPVSGSGPGTRVPSNKPPAQSQPGSAQPGAGQSGSPQPGAGQSGSGQPGSGQPGSAQPGPAQPGPAQPGSAQSGHQPTWPPSNQSRLGPQPLDPSLPGPVIGGRRRRDGSGE